MSETLLMTTSRSAPAASTPCVEGGADGDEQAEEEQRHRERAHGEDGADLAPQQVREEQGQELHRQLGEDALVEVQRGVGALRRARVVGDHEHGLAELAARASPAGRRISSALLRSRSPVGSSQSRNVGSATMARAMATRCCCPPDSSRGLCVGAVGQAHQRSAVSTCRLRSALDERGEQQGQLHVAEGGEHGDQVVHLEDEAHVPGAPRA